MLISHSGSEPSTVDHGSSKDITPFYNGGELHLILYRIKRTVEKFISFHKLVKISSIWQ